MEFSVATQGLIFLAALLCGAVVGLVYDLFRTFRRFIKPGDILLGVQDVAFWVISAILVFLYLLMTNAGELRWFELAGVALGIILYFGTISRIAMKLLYGMLRALGKAAAFALKILLAPIAFVYKLLRRPFIFFINLSGKGIKKAGRAVNRKRESMVKSMLYFLKIRKKI